MLKRGNQVTNHNSLFLHNSWANLISKVDYTTVQKDKIAKISQSEWRLPFWVEFHQKIVNEESVLWLRLTNKTKTTGHSCILYDSHSQMKASYSYVPYYCTKLVSTRKYSLMKHSTTVRACHWEMQAISLHAFIQIYSTPLGECNEPATL